MDGGGTLEYRVHQLEVRRDTAQELAKAGHLAVNKTFVARKPHTYISATAEGRKVFNEHVAALQSIFKTK